MSDTTGHFTYSASIPLYLYLDRQRLAHAVFYMVPWLPRLIELILLGMPVKHWVFDPCQKLSRGDMEFSYNDDVLKGGVQVSIKAVITVPYQLGCILTLTNIYQSHGFLNKSHDIVSTYSDFCDFAAHFLAKSHHF